MRINKSARLEKKEINRWRERSRVYKNKRFAEGVAMSGEPTIYRGGRYMKTP